MAINIELYTKHEAVGQVGDEETYIVGESGPEQVTKLPREIREIK